jgi:hypothetical protein
MPEDTISGIKVTTRKREKNSRAMKAVKDTTEHTYRLLVVAIN